MEQPLPGVEQSKQQERAHRILDAAADLLERWGYKRVTIDDIAKHAGVGKGTVYLHWKTRDTLFETLLIRESMTIVREMIQDLRSDPAEILPHRMMNALFVRTMKHPLIKGLVTNDIEQLGRLAQSTTSLQMKEMVIMKGYFALLRDHGLLLTDIELDKQFYAFEAVITGFFLADQYMVEASRLGFEEGAQALAHIIRLAFEPATPPSPAVLQEVAPDVIQYFEQLYEQYQLFVQTHLES